MMIPKIPEEQRKEFEAIARQMIRFLNDNCHPHVTVIITQTNAELTECACSTGQIMDYVKDNQSFKQTPKKDGVA